MFIAWYWHLMPTTAADSGSKVRSEGQWVAANCAALPTANAGQYAASYCKPLLFWFPCKRWYINVWIFNLLTFNSAVMSSCAQSEV